MQRIRPAVEVLSSGIGVEHALAPRQLYTDGAEVLYDYATSEQDEELRGLTVVRTGQQQFAEVVRDYLECVAYGDDGWASRVRLPVYQQAQVMVDPRRAFGMPLVVHGGVRVEDLVDRFVAGAPSRTSRMISACPSQRSRTWSVSPPERRPDIRSTSTGESGDENRPVEFPIDRSLSRKHLAQALGDLDFVVHTMASVYGERVAQQLEDERWLAGARKHDWIVLMKDDAIRRRPSRAASPPLTS
jgi:hypothetical protein